MSGLREVGSELTWGTWYVPTDMAGTSNWETLTYLVLVELASRWWTGRAPGFIPLEIDPKQGLFRGLRKWFVTGSFLIPWSCPVSKPWRVKAPGYFWHSRAGRFWACSARSGSPRRSLSQRHPPATSVRGMRRPAIRRSLRPRWQAMRGGDRWFRAYLQM